jgi:hypothetical protein
VCARRRRESGGDSYYQGGSLSYSNEYDEDEDYGDHEHQQRELQDEGPTYWEGEDMIYARSSSPFGSSDPLLFVFTKDEARQPAPAMVESQFYEIRSRAHDQAAGTSESESSPGSSSSGSVAPTSSANINNNGISNASGETETITFSVDATDEFTSTWQRMLMGMDKLLDILPRSTMPFASSPSPPGERRSPQAGERSPDAKPSQLTSSGDGVRRSAGSVAESFVMLHSSRSRSPSPTSSTESMPTIPAPALQGR